MNGFDDAMILIRLVSDPEVHRIRLQELQATIDASAARQAEADSAHAKLETERSRLAKLADDLREREVKVHLAESKNESDLEEVRRWKREHTPSRLISVGPGGLTKEPDLTQNAPDPISDRYAEPMGKPAAANVRRTSARVRA
jgi:hypothetical protein